MKTLSALFWITALAATFGLGPSSAIAENDVVRFGGDFELKEGQRAHAVVVLCGHARVNGTVEGDVVVVFGTATLGSNAVVRGDVVVIGAAKIARNAVVHHDTVIIGDVREEEGFKPGAQFVKIGSRVPEWLRDYIGRGLFLGRLIVPNNPWMWAAVAILFLLNLMLLLLFHRPIAASSEALCKRPLLSFLLGLLVILIAPPGLLLVISTLVGILTVPFLMLALMVALLLGKVAVYQALGDSFARRTGLRGLTYPVAALAAGTIIVCLLYTIPIVGFVAFGLAQIFALGSVSVAIVESFKPQPAPAPATPPLNPQFSYVYVATAPVPAPATAAAVAEPLVTPLPPITNTPPVDLTSLPRAGLAIRLGAGLIDLALLGLCCNWLFHWMHHNGTILLLMLAAYHIFFWTWRGTTVGGSVCGLKVVRMNGQPLRLEDAVVRGLASLLSLAALGLGFFWVAFTPEKLAWHDRIAGTCLVRMPKGAPLV